ncbi:hypothetical protein AALO_G00201350 [Alosa alosa]|uniref:DDE Tnp4 domain-containing protein n=1 Tax=Alosa alosa TaxID=278164 RepID=A0AAV6G3E0_9TELE|nr:hypothetical protein AALO_G00201350 [Alosa alosa]
MHCNQNRQQYCIITDFMLVVCIQMYLVMLFKEVIKHPGIISCYQQVAQQCVDDPYGVNAVVVIEDQSFPLWRNHLTVPQQCVDDPYGFNATMVIGDRSFPLRRCHPFQLPVLAARPLPEPCNDGVEPLGVSMETCLDWERVQPKRSEEEEGRRGEHKGT